MKKENICKECRYNNIAYYYYKLGHIWICDIDLHMNHTLKGLSKECPSPKSQGLQYLNEEMGD